MVSLFLFLYSPPKMILDLQARSWPFQQARRILQSRSDNKMMTFETGYGPSGLPHIGTFGEVVRTTMVRQALQQLSDIPTRLICFSDDMDGLRKVPDNIPNKEKIAPFLNYPLTKVPDPFGQYDSFGAHNNAKLCHFLDALGMDYSFKSSTECYQTGLFDEMLLRVLAEHQKILKVILPTLGADRQKTYSPFLPISRKSGRVLQVPVTEYKKDTIVFHDEDGSLQEVPVTGGHCKLQWKVDWGMRWAALGVDYEMAGKDLIDSVTLSSKICKILGYRVPETFIYEHFLDDQGGKISKSKGNGVSIEDWTRYAPIESLSYFMFLKPQTAKRLFVEIIPRTVDDYLHQLRAFPQQDQTTQMDNPVWSVHNGNPPAFLSSDINFSLLLNLVSVCATTDKNMIWSFIVRMDPSLKKAGCPIIDKMIDGAIIYYKDKVEPFKTYKIPTSTEQQALSNLAERLKSCPSNEPSIIQQEVYEAGKPFFDNLKDWFSCFYQVLLGQKSGPRAGTFIALYGKEETYNLIQNSIKKTN